MQNARLEKALRLQSGRMGHDLVVPNPKLKLLDQGSEVLRLRHSSGVLGYPTRFCP